MAYRDGWQERIKGIHAISMIGWWSHECLPLASIIVQIDTPPKEVEISTSAKSYKYVRYLWQVQHVSLWTYVTTGKRRPRRRASCWASVLENRNIRDDDPHNSTAHYSPRFSSFFSRLFFSTVIASACP